jgi:hypothetical protein
MLGQFLSSGAVPDPGPVWLPDGGAVVEGGVAAGALVGGVVGVL